MNFDLSIPNPFDWINSSKELLELNWNSESISNHFKNENYWWGITSALGDDLLHTFPKPQEVSKSETVLDLEKRFEKETAII